MTTLSSNSLIWSTTTCTLKHVQHTIQHIQHVQQSHHTDQDSQNKQYCTNVRNLAVNVKKQKVFAAKYSEFTVIPTQIEEKRFYHNNDVDFQHI